LKGSTKPDYYTFTIAPREDAYGKPPSSEPGINVASTLNSFKFTLKPEGIPQEKIERVEYQLHPTFPDALRIVKQAPFELKEKALGPFTAQAKVYLKNRSEPEVFTSSIAPREN
jgi:hypothetical protein